MPLSLKEPFKKLSKHVSKRTSSSKLRTGRRRPSASKLPGRLRVQPTHLSSSEVPTLLTLLASHSRSTNLTSLHLSQVSTNLTSTSEKRPLANISSTNSPSLSKSLKTLRRSSWSVQSENPANAPSLLKTQPTRRSKSTSQCSHSRMNTSKLHLRKSALKPTRAENSTLTLDH